VGARGDKPPAYTFPRAWPDPTGTGHDIAGAKGLGGGAPFSPPGGAKGDGGLTRGIQRTAPDRRTIHLS